MMDKRAGSIRKRGFSSSSPLTYDHSTAHFSDRDTERFNGGPIEAIEALKAHV
jgi:hypothetical protein